MDAVDNATPMVGGTAMLDDNLVNFDTEPAKIEEPPEEAVILRSLEPPLRDSAPSQSAILGSPSKTRPSSVIATKNTRKRMEDRHVVLHDLKAYLPSALQAKVDSEEHVSYYAVFDGHAGTDAAAHAAAHLHEHVIESASYPSDPVAAFTEAFIKCDEEFVTKSKKSGTTAICSLIKGETIFTAWLGDSQAVLIRNGIPVKIVEAHKPNRDDERKRIEALGGTIMHWGTWRVNGQLAVSRAIGDGEYKPYISAQPDVTTSVNNGSEEFLIIGCDGLWDTVTPEEATEIVYIHLEENRNSGGDIENIGARLATAAKDKGSGDNITIIVVFIMPVAEVIALGRRNTVGQQPDMTGLSTTCDHVRSGGSACTRDSLEPSKDKPDYTSPNVSFASLEGGQMFSPDPFGSVDNGFNLSSEQFDNRIDDKRFSNESNGGTGEENFNGQHMDELLKQQSIAKVEDLFKMLDREDSSPTPEEDDEDARPLEEILAAAREQPQDEVDGVEDDDSSDDEIVDFGACNDLNEASKTDLQTGKGNENLEQVLQLDDKSLTEEQEETDTFTEDMSRPRRTYQEPTMDPCEQVTVKETGPQEYSTIVPPAQEMPSFQKPVIEIVDPMTCSMVKEETEQEAVSEVKTNGETDLVSFESSDEKVEGFMLKTPGQNGGEMLAQFSPEEEPETSVDITDKVAPVTDALASLSIPEVAVTPATPVKERSPAPTPRKEEEATEESSSKKEAPKATPKKSVTTKPVAASKATPGKPAPVAKSAPAKKETPGASKSTTKTATSTKASTTAKSTATTARPAAAARATTSATRTTATRPTSATAGSRTKPGDDLKSTKSGGSSGSSVASGNVRATPRSAATKPLERKPMPSKPDTSANRKPVVSRTADAAKTKPETKEAARLPPKRPTSSTLSKASSSASTPGMSRQTSSASSASSNRPKPTTTSSSRLASASSRPTATKTPAAAGEETKKTLTSSRLASRASTSSLRQTPAAAAPVNKSLSSTAPRPNPTLRRTTSATTTRAANSTTAVKPTAAAERVRAARAAAMSKVAPSKTKSKPAGIKKPATQEEVKDASPEEVETKVNGHSDGNQDALNGVNKETVETVSPATEAGDSNPDKNNDTQTLNGLSEINQSEC